MIPKFDMVVSDLDEYIQSSKTYKIDSFNGRISSKIDDLESVKQAVFKILQTERFENVIYDDTYGVEFIRFIGKSKDFVKADIERTIKEALLMDDRILDIENFKIIDENKEILNIEFEVNSIYGNIGIRSEVKV
ncbi:DUF2634 domain-containing protein [Clostridium baratii]